MSVVSIDASLLVFEATSSLVRTVEVHKDIKKVMSFMVAAMLKILQKLVCYHRRLDLKTFEFFRGRLCYGVLVEGSNFQICVLLPAIEKVTGICEVLWDLERIWTTGSDIDMLPIAATEMIREGSLRDFQDLSFKLFEHWFQENPRSMLRWAPAAALRHFSARFAHEDIETDRIELPVLIELTSFMRFSLLII